MYTALYRAERPETFGQILGQEHIVKILKHQLSTGAVSHAYLFCGTRGTGKTTTARILAKGVNCTEADENARPCGHCANCKAISEGSFMDVIEIDAASNNGVDNIRELRESVKYPPAVGRKKVYIIDEVHMLSSGAFNALLKTLEEPPENVMFILATTEPQKLPATILSRCMRLDFKRVPQQLLMQDMGRICREKGVEITDNALRLLANCADGSVRDGLSVLDQVLASGEKHIDRGAVLEYIGSAGEDFFIDLTDYVSLHKVAEALVLLDRVLSDGKDAKQLMKDWVTHYRNLMVTKFLRNPEDKLNMATVNIERIAEQSRHVSLEEINDAIIRLSSTINDARWSTQPRILLELATVAIATGLQEQQGRPSRPMQPASSVATHSTPTFQPAQKGTPQGAPNTNTELNYPTEVPIDGSKGSSVKSLAGSSEVVVQEAAATESMMTDRDKDALWHRVFEEGEDEEGSFNLIRTGTTLVGVGEREFTVVTNGGFTKRFTEQKRDQLEAIMERNLGRRLKMVCLEEREWHALAGTGNNASAVHQEALNEPAGSASGEEDMNRLVEEVGKTLGLDIELE